MLRIIRTRLAGVLTLAAMAATSTAVSAGPGHDHGPEPTSAIAPSSPRVVAVSEGYELVGILEDGKLTIYLDRTTDTSPVPDARIEMTVGGETALAKPQPDGTYLLQSPILNRHGDHEVIATIDHGGRSDLLIGILKNIPGRSHSDHATYDHDHADHHRDEKAGRAQSPHGDVTLISKLTSGIDASMQQLSNAPLLAGLGLALGLLIGAFVRGRAGLMLGIIGLVAVLGAGVAWAGPGHDHGEGGTALAQGNAPRRLPDGVLFLPKPTQRLLAIRTRVLATETARSADRLIGRVIADPNRSGLVQSTIGGRILATAEGLPALGQRVKKGQVLANVEPAFAPIDASDVRQTAGDLAQRIGVLEARIARQQRLVDKGVVNAASLEDLAIERNGLEARRKALTEARNEPEKLIVPVDGVIAEVRVVAGQVVTTADTLFNIVDPESLWVEAISFDPRMDPSGAKARARTSDGELFALTFIGRSRALQQQATVLQFRVDKSNEALSIGSPVKVLVEKGEPVAGLIIPRSAIAQAPNGQLVAFKRLEPERYMPVAVRTRDLDGERVIAESGLKPGDQIIVEGAPLVNQIR
ncbi:MAG: efflux RND transporter periplasmic adaptor subunit [Hyphomicrobiaceae bacterium]|nr:efflux RND transporter periplasmic adaptor subunit [Hyphomicrobiaceae bacterium]